MVKFRLWPQLVQTLASIVPGGKGGGGTDDDDSMKMMSWWSARYCSKSVTG